MSTAVRTIPTDAMVPPRRRSPAPGPLGRLRRQARFQLRPAVPCRQSRLRSGHGGLTPNCSAVPIVAEVCQLMFFHHLPDAYRYGRVGVLTG
jgi:hypothetical protein